MRTRFWLVMLVGLSVMSAVVSATGIRKTTVVAEPLSCYEQGKKLVCFDGTSIGQMKCAPLDGNAVLCSPVQQRR